MGHPATFNHATGDVEKAMAPSTLDLFILTFNCAKSLINVGVFSAHLHGALSQNATGLPDLVAFSLQEVSPLSYAFIGSYFLSPYYARYEEALNLAAMRLLATSSTDTDDGSEYAATQQLPSTPASARIPARPYTLVRAKNVGMTSILLFARDPTSIHSIEEAEAGFGAADMGNKGAVALRVLWGDDIGRTTEVTLVATHLAAMEWNLKKRNANWRTIMSNLTFGNPRAALPHVFPPSTAAPSPDRSGTISSSSKTHPVTSSSSSETSSDDSESETPLLSSPPTTPNLTPSQRTTLRDLSIYKPTSHLFVSGDLNYRISTTTPPPQSQFPSFDPSSPNHYPHFLPLDQLTQERLAGRALHGLSEAPINFGPTYKYNILSSPEGAENEAAVLSGQKENGIQSVPWRFASHRWPGWCDRILYLDLPSWVKSAQPEKQIEVKAYDSLPVVETSDHRAVFMRVKVPVLGTEEMALPEGVEVGAKGETGVDPRVTPPVEVDVHAWERRAAARRREIVVGFTALLWSTKEGALLMVTMWAAVVGGWWVWRG